MLSHTEAPPASGNRRKQASISTLHIQVWSRPPSPVVPVVVFANQRAVSAVEAARGLGSWGVATLGFDPRDVPLRLLRMVMSVTSRYLPGVRLGTTITGEGCRMSGTSPAGAGSIHRLEMSSSTRRSAASVGAPGGSGGFSTGPGLRSCSVIPVGHPRSATANA